MNGEHGHLLALLLAIVVRTALVVLALAVGLRLLGKRQLGQINIYDLALIMLLANAVQNAMTEGSGLLGAGFASAGTLLFLGAGLTAVFVRAPKLEQRLVGMPTVIIQDGVLLTDHLRRERITHDQVMQVLREHDFQHIRQVRLAVLEADGTLSVVGYPEAAAPPTPPTPPTPPADTVGADRGVPDAGG